METLFIETFHKPTSESPTNIVGSMITTSGIAVFIRFMTLPHIIGVVNIVHRMFFETPELGGEGTWVIQPELNAISSKQAIFKPCRCSIVCTK